MSNRAHIAAALVACLALFPAAPALADGEILVTHAKALAGNVTPGDTAGYPVTISTPGLFKLASNLFVTANKIGIQVTSKNVTIDLNGFTIEGSGVAWYGIVGSVNAVTIANGTITQFKFDGIHGGDTSGYWIVDNVRSIENDRDGIKVGPFAVIQSNIAVRNGRRGIYADVSSVIQGNTVSENANTGIETIRSTVVGNTINSNGGIGLAGATTSGYSGNTLMFNNSGGDQALGVLPQHPNACNGPCP
jgi:hypothetical protein